MMHYKFVSWDVPEWEKVKFNEIPAALEAWDSGNREPLKSLHIATQEPIFRCMGWAVPYSEYLRRFWVKTKHYGIIEMYSLNKTDIRKELKTECLKIVEVI